LWELSCVLHDRQQNQIEAYNTEKQSEKIEQKKENFFSRFLSRLTNYFN
jgi:hypothetical protein